MTEHVSDLQWDRLLAGELTAEAGAAAHTHAARCTACAARLRELTAERDAFRVRPIAISLSRPRRRWLPALIPAAAAAAVLIALNVRPGPSHSVTVIAAPTKGRDPAATPAWSSDGSLRAPERSKGSAGSVAFLWARARIPDTALLLSAGRPDALRPVASGDVVRPGDHLQAGYTATRSGFGAVLSRDGAGSVTTYVPPGGEQIVPRAPATERSFPLRTLLHGTLGDERVVTAYVPPGGEQMVPLAPGKERSFPLSTILDDTLGDERIAIVWCETAHPLAPLLAALRDGRPIAAPDDCTVREVMLDKRLVAPDIGLHDEARPSMPVDLLQIPSRP